MSLSLSVCVCVSVLVCVCVCGNYNFSNFISYHYSIQKNKFSAAHSLVVNLYSNDLLVTSLHPNSSKLTKQRILINKKSCVIKCFYDKIKYSSTFHMYTFNIQALPSAGRAQSKHF